MLVAFTSSPASPWALLPFVVILLAIALMPFVHQEWWERHYHYIALGLGGVVVLYYVAVLGEGGRMLHVAHEYVSFIALIGSLFIVAGGIHLAVHGEATPLRNVAFLLVGCVLANFIGTTGASMLLIRPFIRLNQRHMAGLHIVFFIFLVSNVGGCLTPLGDPPLFLGFLRGVPFWWELQHCWSAWLIATGALLAIFYVLDCRHRAQGPRVEGARPGRLAQVQGGHNFFFLALIIGAVFVSRPTGLREGLMFAAAAASWYTTTARVRQANDFNFHPVKEVAWLFLGIFATMVPALDYLQTHAAQLGLNSDMKFYWMTGLLAGFLDNAPTYLTTLSAALGQHGWSIDVPAEVQLLLNQDARRLLAISLGAVFFGGLTYIGNGPNFMVRAIAEHARVPVPSFFGYLGKYAIPILLPVLALIGLLFFSRWRVL